MVGNLVLRGIMVGIVAGLLAFGWAKTFAEPAIDVAIAFESAQDEAAAKAAIARGEQPPPDGPDIFSRTVQGGVGLLTGVVSVGAGLGGFFAVLFAFANGRMGKLGPKPTAALLAVAGLVTFYIVPALKYPANPPSVGHPDTIAFRTGIYFLMMAISVASTLGALALRRNLVPRYGGWNGSLMAIGAYFVVLAAAFLILPGLNEVPATFPAVILWQFRLASLSTQIILWMGTGLIFGFVGGQVVENYSRSNNGRNAAFG